MEAETVALHVLRFLASEEARLQRFLDTTGLGLGELRARAAEPQFLAGVLDYLLADESLLLAFAADEGLPPDAPAAARRRLPGAAPC